MRLVISALAVLLMALPALGANITARPNKTNPTEETRVSFTTNHAVDTISDAIPTCLSMEVLFEQATASVVSIYAVSPSDNTVSEVEAATRLLQLTGDTPSPISISTGKNAIRFVVDTAETSGDSFAVVRCSRSASNLEGQVNRDLLAGPWAEYINRIDTTTGEAASSTTVAAKASINFSSTIELVEKVTYDQWNDQVITCDDSDNVFNTYEPDGTADQTLVRSNFNAFLQTQTNPFTNALYTSAEADYLENEPEVCFMKDDLTFHVVVNVNAQGNCTDAEIENATTGGMAGMFTLTRTELGPAKYTNWAISNYQKLPSSNCEDDTLATIAAGTIGQEEFVISYDSIFYSPYDDAYFVATAGGGSNSAAYNPGASDGNGGGAYPNIEPGIYKLNPSLTGIEGGTTANPFEYAPVYSFSGSAKGQFHCDYDFRTSQVWCIRMTLTEGTDMEAHQIFWPLRREIKVHDLSSFYAVSAGPARVRSIAVDSAQGQAWLGSNKSVTNELFGLSVDFVP